MAATRLAAATQRGHARIVPPHRLLATRSRFQPQSHGEQRHGRCDSGPWQPQGPRLQSFPPPEVGSERSGHDRRPRCPRCRDGEVDCSRTALEGRKENISRPTASSAQVIRLLREQQAGPLTLRAKATAFTPLENKVPERIMAERALPSSRTHS